MKKDKILVFIFCLIISFLVILLNSKCSFLYPFNGWDDFNSFYTIGAGWASGMIPYRDLFEQKGPFLYLIFMISHFISPYKFTGVFMMEVLFFTLVLYISYKIIRLFINDIKTSLVILFLYAVLVTTSFSFITGGSSEEFNLLFTTITFYYLVKYLKNDNLIDISYKDLAINGLACGFSLLIKYTTIGFWFIFMLFVTIGLLKKKRIKDAFKKGFFFILMMLLPLLLFSFYFYFNDALYDFYNVYFYINIFGYGEKLSFFTTLYDLGISFLAGFAYNIFIFILLNIVYFITVFKAIRKKIKINKKYIHFLIIVIFSIMFLYLKQAFRPYALLVMFPFVLMLLIHLYKIIRDKKKFGILSFVLGLVILFISIDYDYMKVRYEDTVYYRFGEIINKVDNPTILQYRSIDEGFYTASKVVPNVRFFEQVNIDYDDLNDNFLVADAAIKNKDVDFVIVRQFDIDRYNDSQSLVSKNAQMDFNNIYKTHYLYLNYDLVEKFTAVNGYYDSCSYYLYKVRN